jgi:formyltetrahydrofolate hydrolase
MSPECEKLNKRLAVLISLKKKQKYSHIIADICTRLRFSLLNATIIAILGYRRGGNSMQEEVEVDMDVDFGLIPRESTYEA